MKTCKTFKLKYLHRLNADVPVHAQQLLAYKIQSPIEKEAVAGLKVFIHTCIITVVRRQFNYKHA